MSENEEDIDLNAEAGSNEAPFPLETEGQTGGGMSWGYIIFQILYACMMIFAVYTAHACGGGILNYLAAVFCPIFYLPYYYLKGKNNCSVGAAPAVQSFKMQSLKGGMRGGFRR
jgi:hypothetical protein